MDTVKKVRRLLSVTPWALAGTIVLAHTVTLALAQTQQPRVFTACYVPNVGAMYLIKETGLAQSCLAGTHVEVSWNQAGTTGAAPSGAVLFFDLTTCPDGWTEFTLAAGRTLVGRPTGGSVGGTVGTPLTNLQDRTHTHAVDPASTFTASAGTHNHRWAFFDVNEDWYTWASDGVTTKIIVNWGDGIDPTSGSGLYPFAYDNTFTSTQSDYTEDAGSHSHTIDIGSTTTTTASTSSVMPYTQLLACRKS